MDGFCAQFPAFVAWYTNIHGVSPVSVTPPRSPGSPHLPPRPLSASPDTHRKWLEDQDKHEYDDPWRSHNLEYYEMETLPQHEYSQNETQPEHEYSQIETQPDVPEYYAPPTAALHQPDGADAPWNKYTRNVE